MFANQAAVAIEQSRTHRNLAALIGEVLESLGGVSEHNKARLLEGMHSFAAQTEEDPTYRRALDLARMVQEIVWQGESESDACQAILKSFANYLRTRSRTLEIGDLG